MAKTLTDIDRRPPIDLQAPTDFETATFALG